eukprot:Sdes_comp19440_c0_seq1m10828
MSNPDGNSGHEASVKSENEADSGEEKSIQIPETKNSHHASQKIGPSRNKKKMKNPYLQTYSNPTEGASDEKNPLPSQKLQKGMFSFTFACIIVSFGALLNFAGIGISCYCEYIFSKYIQDAVHIYNSDKQADQSVNHISKFIFFSTWNDWLSMAIIFFSTLISLAYVFKISNNLYASSLGSISTCLSLFQLFVWTRFRKEMFCVPQLLIQVSCKDAKLAIVAWSCLFFGSFLIAVGCSPGNRLYSSITLNLGKWSNKIGLISHFVVALLVFIGAALVLIVAAKSYHDDLQDGLTLRFLSDAYYLLFLLPAIVIFFTVWHLYDYVNNRLLRMTFLAFHSIGFLIGYILSQFFSTNYVFYCETQIPFYFYRGFALASTSCPLRICAFLGSLFIMLGEFCFLFINSVSYFSASENYDTQSHPIFNNSRFRSVFMAAGVLLSSGGSVAALYATIRSVAASSLDDSIRTINKADLYFFYFVVCFLAILISLFSLYMQWFYQPISRRSRKSQNQSSSAKSFLTHDKSSDAFPTESSSSSSLNSPHKHPQTTLHTDSSANPSLASLHQRFVSHRLHALLLTSLHIPMIPLLLFWSYEITFQCRNSLNVDFLPCGHTTIAICGVFLMLVGHICQLLSVTVLPFF